MASPRKRGPVAFRPRFSAGLALSVNECSYVLPKLYRLTSHNCSFNMVNWIILKRCLENHVCICGRKLMWGLLEWRDN
jgi:hypothetical protein